jgi:hypothetical protein
MQVYGGHKFEFYLLLLLFELFDRRSAAWALMVDLASDVGFRRLFGLMACRILNTAHAVPMAWPAASIPSFVAAAAFSPYLKENKGHGVRGNLAELWPKEEYKQRCAVE